MKISGRTRITGIFGYPVEHTLSPAMHNVAFKALGLDFCYVPFLVHPDHLKDAVNGIKALNLRGVNVTIPHKETVIPFLDDIDEEAAFIGAVNTIVNDEGRLKGYNTDGRGFMKSLSEHGISPDGKDLIIVGAGGASRAISYYLSREAKALYIYDIEREKVRRLVEDLGKIRDNSFLLDEVGSTERYNIIINATPLGLKDEDPLPFETTLLKPGQVVCDLIYKKTKLLKEASRKGSFILDGLGMLLWQGIFAFELWTGKRPPAEIMRGALYDSLK
ncbi:MAG: shikimate dehydrogenase [Nitrospira sp.]|nr:shikimate dehydrogenase [Nitrospira sp.]